MKRLLAVAFAAVWVACYGCSRGAGMGSVSGLVTMDGKPLPNVVVTFVPVEGGRAATGKTDASGKYELVYMDRKGAPIGKHKVSVTTPPETHTVTEMRSDSPEYLKQATTGRTAEYAKAAAFKEPIPPRYNVQTTLVYEVKSGSNVINLELTSK